MKTMRVCCRYEINLQYSVRRLWKEVRNDKAVFYSYTTFRLMKRKDLTF